MVLDSFITQRVELQRSCGGGQYVNGRYINDDYEKTFIEAVIMNASPHEVSITPEARQNIESIKLYTEVPLLVNDQCLNTKADIIVFKCRRYQVLQVMNWSINTCLPHYKSIAQMIDVQGSLS